MSETARWMPCSAEAVCLGLGLLVFAGTSGGCAITKANTVRQKYVRDKASFQLDCSKDKIDVEPLDSAPLQQDESWSVEGCRKKAIYRLTPEGPTLQHSNR